MLHESELTAWYIRLNLSDQAGMLIDQIRSSEPARRVRGGRSNVSGLYPSRKMGVSIQFESHRVELAAIYEMEHDPFTFEFYDQPPPMMLDYNSANGRRMAVRHTPDFFVLRQNSAGWEEWEDGGGLAPAHRTQPEPIPAGVRLLALSSRRGLCDAVWLVVPSPFRKRDPLAAATQHPLHS